MKLRELRALIIWGPHILTFKLQSQRSVQPYIDIHTYKLRHTNTKTNMNNMKNYNKFVREYLKYIN